LIVISSIEKMISAVKCVLVNKDLYVDDKRQRPASVTSGIQ
jgi:hypothetical protein